MKRFVNAVVILFLKAWLRIRQTQMLRLLHASLPQLGTTEQQLTLQKMRLEVQNLVSRVILGPSAQEEPRLIGPWLELQNQNQAILLTGHFLNLEEGAATLATSLRSRIYYVFQPAPLKWLASLLLETRVINGLHPVHFGSFNRALASSIKSGETAYWSIASDLTPIVSKPKEVEFPFLGRQRHFHSGAIRLAMKHKLPLYFWHLKKEEGQRILVLSKIADQAAEESLEKLTSRYVQLLEEAIENNPDYWAWFYNRWR